MRERSVGLFVKSILALVWVVVVVVVAAVVDVAVVVWLRAGAASAGWLGVVGGAVNERIDSPMLVRRGQPQLLLLQPQTRGSRQHRGTW